MLEVSGDSSEQRWGSGLPDRGPRWRQTLGEGELGGAKLRPGEAGRTGPKSGHVYASDSKLLLDLSSDKTSEVPSHLPSL